MLLDLESFDIDICHDQRAHEDDGEKSDAKLSRYFPAEGIPGDHQDANGAEQGQEDNDITVDPVE